jgi:hypothetical protein
MDATKLAFKRVKKERDDLKERTVKLENTIGVLDKTPYITDENKTLLKLQLSTMQHYLQILERRLELFDQENK